MLYSIDSVDINLWNVFFDMKSVLEQPMTLGSPTGYVVDVSGHRGSEASRMLHTDLLPQPHDHIASSLSSSLYKFVSIPYRMEFRDYKVKQLRYFVVSH